MDIPKIKALLGVNSMSFQQLTDLLQSLDKLKDEVVETKTGIYRITLNNFLETDPEVVELNKTIDMGHVIPFLRGGREHIDGGAMYSLNQKRGGSDSAQILVELGLLDEDYWYYNEQGDGYGNHKFDDKEDRDTCYELNSETGEQEWCDPIRGIVVSKAEFDENSYTSYKTTEKYHEIAKRLNKALHS